MGQAVPVGVKGGSTASAGCWTAPAGSGEIVGEVDSTGEGRGDTRAGSAGNGEPAQHQRSAGHNLLGCHHTSATLRVSVLRAYRHEHWEAVRRRLRPPKPAAGPGQSPHQHPARCRQIAKTWRAADAAMPAHRPLQHRIEGRVSLRAQSRRANQRVIKRHRNAHHCETPAVAEIPLCHCQLWQRLAEEMGPSDAAAEKATVSECPHGTASCGPANTWAAATSGNPEPGRDPPACGGTGHIST